MRAMQHNPQTRDPIAIDVVESPDGVVLTLIIGAGAWQEGEALEALKRAQRRAPKRAYTSNPNELH
jgi:hypothetical protein